VIVELQVVAAGRRDGKYPSIIQRQRFNSGKYFIARLRKIIGAAGLSESTEK